MPEIPEEEEEPEIEEEDSLEIDFTFDPDLFQSTFGLPDFNKSEPSAQNELEIVVEPIVIKTKITEMSQAGEMKIKFDPPKVKVPDNWDALWDEEKKANLTDS
jgi:hypothetical protein